MVKSTFIKKGKVVRLVLSNTKVHYKATKIKKHHDAYWPKNRLIDQWDQKESSETVNKREEDELFNKSLKINK